MTLKPGVYFLQNVRSGTFLDLRKDRKGVDGFAFYGGTDQQWEIGKLSNRGWFIRSCYSVSDHYLTVEKALGHCTDIAVNEFPTAWIFEHEPKQGESVYWIHWPNSSYSFDLDGGKRDDGVKVYLVNKYDARQQLWKLIRCPEKDQASTTVMKKGSVGTTVTTTVTTMTTTTVVRKKDDAEAEETTWDEQALTEDKTVVEEPLQH